MSQSTPRVSLVTVIGADDAANAAALTAATADLDGVELVLVSHGGDAPVSLPGDTTLSSAALSPAGAFREGVAAASGDAVVWWHPAARPVGRALVDAADQLAADAGIDAVVSRYQLVGADGTPVHEIAPEQDGDTPPPGWESAVVMRRAVAERVPTSLGLPAMLAVFRDLVGSGRVAYAGVGFTFPFNLFALTRFDLRRDLNLLHIQERPFEADTPWASVIVCGDGADAIRGTLGRLVGQVMPPGTYEVVVVDTGDGALADAVDAAASVVPLSSARASGASRGAALQAGVTAARGEMLVFVDGQATPFPDLVEQHVRAHRAMAPRDVVVLGTWEVEATAMTRALPRLLDATDLVPGRTGLGSGQFHDGDALHLGHVSFSKEVLLRAGGLDTSLPDSMLDRDLGRRLADLGYRPYYHDAARVIRPPTPDLNALRAARIQEAEDLVRFYDKHPSALEQSSLGETTLAELDEKIDANRASVQPVASAAGALVDLELAALETIGDDWRAFTDDVTDRLEKLIRHLDVLWRAEGMRAGLRAAGVDGFPSLLAQHPRPVPGARNERLLLVPHSDSEDRWLVALGRYLAGFARDEDTTLVVLADENAGVPVRSVREAAQLLTGTVRPHRDGGWPHVLIVDRGTLGGSLLRFVAGMTGVVQSGGPDAETFERLAGLCGVPTVDTAAWEGRADGGVTPATLRTDSPIRILAWPKWSDVDELIDLMTTGGLPLCDRDDATLCLVYRPEDGDPEASLENLAQAFDAVIGPDRALDVLLIEDEYPADALPGLGRAIDAVVGLKSAGDGPRAAFVAALGVPTVSDAGDVAARVAAATSRNPGPLVPSQVYVA